MICSVAIYWRVRCPMSKNCGGGRTGDLVNGRWLHQKDLDLLVGWGLWSTSGSYIIETTGRVWDESGCKKLYFLESLHQHQFLQPFPLFSSWVMLSIILFATDNLPNLDTYMLSIYGESCVTCLLLETELRGQIMDWFFTRVPRVFAKKRFLMVDDHSDKWCRTGFSHYRHKRVIYCKVWSSFVIGNQYHVFSSSFSSC